MGILKHGKKIGLALGGGVARCMAHIGVLKAFKKENIPIDYIASSSGGSLIGGFFAFGLDPLYIECELISRKTFSFLSMSLRQISPFSYNIVQKMFEDEIGKRPLNAAIIPIAIITMDLRSGNLVIFDGDEDVATIVAASSAFPGVFKPIKYKNWLLADGGALDNLPVDQLEKAGVDIKIAIDCLPSKPISKDPSNAIQTIGRAVDIMIKKASIPSGEKADVWIEPDFPADLWLTDFYRAEEIVAVGEKAAQEKIPQIKSLLGA